MLFRRETTKIAAFCSIFFCFVNHSYFSSLFTSNVAIAVVASETCLPRAFAVFLLQSQSPISASLYLVTCLIWFQAREKAG
ncbi:hypothetical protein B0T24DRAFT_303751 [Lasiosphaeria ovina]|uniref:Uncharacterized protein n=1 Tax=Lasiosphaeria ovina TaxID=92902 RepID=A0AAE0K7H1_9PEZI|nr:hypothetical protein B0T24DRAFT_303751 [Lasiosphaeria ovina]